VTDLIVASRLRRSPVALASGVGSIQWLFQGALSH